MCQFLLPYVLVFQNVTVAGAVTQNWPVTPPYYFSKEFGGSLFSSGPTWPDYLGNLFNVTVLDYAIGGKWPPL